MTLSSCQDLSLTPACVGYCVDRFEQFPVTYDPLLAGFGTVVHHLDTAFSERLRPGYVTPAIAQHQKRWHGGTT